MTEQLREPVEKLQFAMPKAGFDYGAATAAELRRLRMVCDTLVTAVDELAGALAEEGQPGADGLQTSARRVRQMLVGMRSDSLPR
ncbi:MAG TPA: hypothetical protein VFH38_08250 [Jatrophihabitans sp.]|nr:hypothetical protein [Jatrophihabitans sp.]